MKKRLCLLLLIILHFHINASAQDVSGLMTKQHYNCGDITYNGMVLVPKYYEKHNADTVAAIMQYWKAQCPGSEALARLNILLAIDADTFREQLYEGEPIVRFLQTYRDRIRYSQNGGSVMTYSNGHLMPYDSLHDFTYHLATRLSQRPANSALTNFFLDFYSDNADRAFLRLYDSSFAGFEITRQYHKLVKEQLRKPEVHLAIFTGIWMPRGALNILGNHPVFGFQAGLKNRKKMMFDLCLELRVGNSAHPYWTTYKGSQFQSTHFLGAMFAAELGYELLRQGASELDLVGGIGFESIELLSIGKSNDPNRISKSVNSFNANLGLGYRFYLPGRSYFGIEARYNFNDYNNDGGTGLSGNAFCIRLKYGVSRHLPRDQALQDLDHPKIVFDQPYYRWLDKRKYSH